MNLDSNTLFLYDTPHPIYIYNEWIRKIMWMDKKHLKMILWEVENKEENQCLNVYVPNDLLFSIVWILNHYRQSTN